MAAEVATGAVTAVESGDLATLIKRNAHTAKAIFFDSRPTGDADGSRKRLRLDPASASSDDPDLTETAVALRLNAEYANVRTLPEALATKQAAAVGAAAARKKALLQRKPVASGDGAGEDVAARKLIEGIEENGSGKKPNEKAHSTALMPIRRLPGAAATGTSAFSAGQQLMRMQDVQAQPRPEWHAPWKLMRVISGHLGWVRSLAVEPGNKWFASGAGDRTIKIWDLASGQLRLTLTGHISTVRGLAVSPRHPYLFSCGEDKMVKCWDLETNKVIRHYHGHLSGVYALALHPTLDVLVTGGRDGVARVWDMRTRSNIHVLAGHTGTIADVRCQEADPQVITGSLDSTVRLWDLAAGKSSGVLTHHKKGVRALAVHPAEFTFASASAGSIKQWKCPEGAFMQNFAGHNAIINALAVNADNVFFSGADNGSMSFWDWKSGHRFQSLDTIAQPGSLDAESGIMAATYDRSGMRLICGEADKTIKIWRQDDQATPQTHPLDWQPTPMQRRY
ncbi:mRNA splicing protein [Grosmannia clavigera kw1407]|uniref:Pre-mRNA-splicing factor PRP46 n=1 Tax=Grosmannia clavigera (strain kw1407 / UAMH 11150) TaxID=655863 RepID=F0XMI0_GROCL|nr:mRNA splicing protein [Grosmannia clavigera kw1407]EFX01438.1 mRNA splicing protein [Grosmannia clavigera kw1407]